MMGQIGILGNSRLARMIYRGLFTVVENHSKSLIIIMRVERKRSPKEGQSETLIFWSNETFWVIFKHCGPVGTHKALEDLEKEKKDGKDLPFDQNDY